ncbi:alkyl hydroperoxide reductase subunit AhpF [Novosphingobium hassiacum]|uniref:Alkyl hydroperoxide reductase subunit AhpF n=1 Tax=Novosphingobium hassiacum TaxID=173676 RepID=A0A7W5ZXN5_9SPHN|nr:hypothetical protein [Novosphingobium hassiacum]MBB3859680.1 alkyl hydroperoxide reductase subunit AhpF [Novosphingobium hassiacum]
MNCPATPAAQHSKVLIIGSGPAGCTAAVYAARFLAGHGDLGVAAEEVRCVALA